MTCKVAALVGGVTPIMPITRMGIAASLRRTGLFRHPQALGSGNVDCAICIDRHGVVTLRLVRRDQAVKHIVAHALRIAGARIAEAAAARQLQANGVTRWHGLTSLGPDRPPRPQTHYAGAAGLPAAAPARRMAHPLEIAQKRQRIGPGAAELYHLAKAAAELSGPARAVAKFAAIEHDRRDAFGGLDRDRAHAGGKRSSAQAVLLRPRAGTAAVKDYRREFRQRIGIGAGLDLIDQRAAAENLWIPQGRSALRRHAAGDRLLQTTGNHVRQHLPDGVARRDRPWPLGI